MNKPQLETTEKAEPASAISVAQLCALTGYSPAFISAQKAALGESFRVPTGSPHGGKPMQMFLLERLAELIIDRTGFLTDAECRLRVALSATASKKGRSKMSSFYDAHTLIEIDDVLEVLPRDHSLLTPELVTKVRAAIAQEHANTRARRGANRSRRITPTTPQETQP
ncbi:hypothetical protein D3C71_1575090 [compost metagenome]